LLNAYVDIIVVVLLFLMSYSQMCHRFCSFLALPYIWVQLNPSNEDTVLKF